MHPLLTRPIGLLSASDLLVVRSYPTPNTVRALLATLTGSRHRSIAVAHFSYSVPSSAFVHGSDRIADCGPHHRASFLKQRRAGRHVGFPDRPVDARSRPATGPTSSRPRFDPFIAAVLVTRDVRGCAWTRRTSPDGAPLSFPTTSRQARPILTEMLTEALQWRASAHVRSTG